jgi:hypothetical protein
MNDPDLIFCRVLQHDLREELKSVKAIHSLRPSLRLDSALKYLKFVSSNVFNLLARHFAHYIHI